MRKGIKILGKTLFWLCIVVIGLPLAVSALLAIPAVQNAVVQQLTETVSGRLQTEVRIGKIQIGVLGKARIDGFYVEDYQRDTLLYVPHLDAYVTGIGLFGGGVTLRRAQIDSAALFLRETPEGVMNIKQVIDRLSNPDKSREGNFRLVLRKATLRGMELRIERLEPRRPEYGIDFGRMRILDLHARVDDLTLDGPTITAAVNTLSAREASGFRLDHLSGNLYMTNGSLGFEGMRVVTPESNVTLPYVALAGESWEVYKDFTETVRIEAAVRNSTLSSNDLAYFAPAARRWKTTFSSIDFDLSGEVDNMQLRVRSLQAGRRTALAARGSITGLPDLRRTRFDMHLERLATNARELTQLARNIAGAELSESLRTTLGHAGEIVVTGRFDGLFSSFSMQSVVATGAGTLRSNLRLKPVRNGLSSVQGEVVTKGLKLSRLLGNDARFGNASLEAYIDGVVGLDRTDAQVSGRISQFDFNGYTYDSLRLDGRLHNREFDGSISARDPNLDFDFAGLVDFNDSVPRYDFAMELYRADLAALHFNSRDSISQLSAHIEANGSGHSLDDLNGTIRVTDGSYRYNASRIDNMSLTLTGTNSATDKYLDLRSSFADVTFRSKTGYRTIADYLRRTATNYLPVISEQRVREARAPRTTAVANDYSMLTAYIRDFNPVADAVSPGLQIGEGSSLSLMFNPANDRLSLRVEAPYIEHNSLLATRLYVNAVNRGDSLILSSSAEDLYAGMLHLPDLSVSGGTKAGNMQLAAEFRDTTRRFAGRFGLRAEIEESAETGRSMDLYVLPSQLTRGEVSWDILARKIVIDTARVVIDRFVVRNREQSLSVNGIASRSRSDSVTLLLNNFDIAPLSQIADRMGYGIEGRTNGAAVMKAMLRDGQLTADIQVDSLAVNGIEGPPVRLTSRWDFAQARAALAVTNRIEGDTLIRGYYNPAQRRYYARLAVQELDMGLLDPVMSGVISDTRGRAAADLVLRGEGLAAQLSGDIRVSDLTTRVDFTQVAYTIPSATLRVEGNRFVARNASVYDREGHRGTLDLTLDMRHLSNIAYDLSVRPQGMLLLDTGPDDNDLFYGRVYGSGSARIRGDKGNVSMDISAMTGDNSSFFMPLTGKSNIAYADFVTFVKPPDAPLDIIAQKKLNFERRRTRGSSSVGSLLNISMALDVRSNTEVELTVSGNTLRGRGNGLLNLSINPTTNLFEMYGDYTIDEGSFRLSLMNLYNKNFQIEPGSTIQWTGSPMDALLDIEAVYNLKASLQPLLQGTSDKLASERSVPVECVIDIGERLTAPEITFDVRVPTSDVEAQTLIANALSTPESVDQQFAALLVFNSFMAENNVGSNFGSSSMGVGTGLELLANTVSNWLSTSDFDVVLRYRPKSKLTGDEVDFGLSKSLINNRLFVELEGNYLIDNKQAVNSAMSNFMGEAYITYLIDRSGALKLKAFTQTIDRFDENQGLQETGIGIYFKEDFDNFADLRSRLRERFIDKNRREARRARREARRRARNEDGSGGEDAEHETKNNN